MPVMDPDASLLQSLLAGVQSAAQTANEKRAEIRDTLAYAMVNPGKGAEGDPRALATHEGWMKGASEGLGKVTSPMVTRTILEGLGITNEGVSGVLSALSGNGFYDPAGYDTEDLDANSRGIEAGLATLPKEEELSEMDLLPMIGMKR